MPLPVTYERNQLPAGFQLPNLGDVRDAGKDALAIGRKDGAVGGVLLVGECVRPMVGGVR